MRAMEAAAVEAGTPERVLQERAGLAVADVVEEVLAARGRGGKPGPGGARPRGWGPTEQLPAGDPGRRWQTGKARERRPARVVVLVGAGNNGRDTVVAGRRLAARGCQVQVWLGPRLGLSDGELR